MQVPNNGHAMHRSPRLLIVDDTVDSRNLLSRRFQRHGYETVEADGGYAALAFISEQPFDLVLLDVTMPDLDGNEVLTRIRAEHSSMSLPVIMVTGRTESDEVVKALKLGASDFVTKPVDFPVALARVEARIAHKRTEEALQQVKRELEHANKELEHRVAERTAELMESNRRLELQIEEGKRSAAAIEHLVHHDALTGLGNRVSFRQNLERMLARVRRHDECVAVLCLDLDHFKMVNDTLGHPIGDMLLNEVAERLRVCSRDTDVVARLGGDEFAIIQAALKKPEDASALAARVVEALRMPYDLDGHQVVIGGSIGISTAPHDGIDPDQLLKNSDLALYRAKAEGRGTYCFFEPDMDLRAQARRKLEFDLRRAVAAGEFELYFQPLVSLETEVITCFEALIRWRHPEHGMIVPGEFIPLAEETGLIVPIGEWVLQSTCVVAASWPDGIKIAVNLSPVQFKNRHLVEAVQRALALSGLQAGRLELEITESVLLDSTEATLATLHQLRALGVRIAMDDFGTGYSSLSYLRSFPFDKIKIDRSFVRDLAEKDDCAAIVRAVAGLGSSLGMATTAEGVETVQQMERLRAEGCTEVQGYLLSPPRPAADVSSMIAASQTIRSRAA